MSETRYDWLVDGQPAQNRYTVLGDVTGSIEVSMEFKTAVTTEVLRTVPVPFVYVTTGRTLLRGITGINGDNLFTKILGLVLDKLFKFVERPGIQFPVELSTTPFLHTDLCEIFKSEHSVGEVNNLLRDTMINVSHKPSFSSGHFTEFPFGGTSAFGLKRGSEVRELSANILHRLRIKERVIGTDCDINNTTINSENGLFRDGLRGIGFNVAMQVKRVIILAKGQSRRLDFPRQILPVIFRDTERDPNPTVRGREGCIPRFEIDAYYPLVIPHRRELFAERFELTLNGFQRLTGNISCTLHKRGWEIRNRLSNILIGGMVTTNLADRTGVESPFGTSVEHHGIISHGFQERFSTIRRNIKFQLDCPNHNHILVVLEHILNGGDRCGAIPPTAKAVGFLAPRS